LGLAQQNLIDHFWADLNDAPDASDPRSFVTYQMVAHFVSGVLSTQFPANTHHQFELRMLMDNTNETVHTHVMMTSPMEAKT
jgi:hypothetical protein